jgi:hypothetical protein
MREPASGRAWEGYGLSRLFTPDIHTHLNEDLAQTHIFLEKVLSIPYLVSSPKEFKLLQSTSSTSQYC